MKRIWSVATAAAAHDQILDQGDLLEFPEFSDTLDALSPDEIHDGSFLRWPDISREEECRFVVTRSGDPAGCSSRYEPLRVPLDERISFYDSSALIHISLFLPVEDELCFGNLKKI